jgi:hypothetical protein
MFTQAARRIYTRKGAHRHLNCAVAMAASACATGRGAAPVLPPPLWAFDRVAVEDSPFDPSNARIRVDG